LHAQPPAAPEPTTMTSYFCLANSAMGSISPKGLIFHAKQSND